MPSAKNNGLLVRKKIKNKVKKLLTIKNCYAIIIMGKARKNLITEVKNGRQRIKKKN